MKVAILATLFFLLAACGRFLGGNEGAWTVDDARDDTFILEVQNDSFNDARIYARWNGERRRLGSVGGRGSERFTLDWRTQALRVEVDFLAAGSFVSGQILVSPGDNIFFRIPAGAR